MALGGDGNDVIKVVSLDFARIDGGSGTDTLVLEGHGLSLDLSVMKNRVAGFEKFELGNDNHMSVKFDDVLRMGEVDLMASDGKKQMSINGSVGSSVDLSQYSSSPWSESKASVDGHSYKVFTSSSVELWVEDAVKVNLVG